MVSATHDRSVEGEQSAANPARGDHEGGEQHRDRGQPRKRGRRLPALSPGLGPGVERRGAEAVAHSHQNNADAKLIERIIEGALSGIPATGLREYLAAAARRDAYETHSHDDPGSSSSPPSVPDPSSPSVPSLVQILERFAECGGIERARNVTRGHEEVIRLGIENLKNEALETLESLAAGAYMRSSFDMDQCRAMELTRRACVSVLRLNPFPTRRDSYNDERGPRMGERKGNHRGTETPRDWDHLVGPFPTGEDVRPTVPARPASAGGARDTKRYGRADHGETHGQNVRATGGVRATDSAPPTPLAPGSARGSNVPERASAQMPADDRTGATNDGRARDRASLTAEPPARKNPPAEPGANAARVEDARASRNDPHGSHGQNVRATENVRVTKSPRIALSPGATFLRSLSAAKESSHPP